MTLQSFYRRVPYAELTQDQYGNIRHAYNQACCPIDCAGGDWTKNNGGLGLTPTQRDLIITAADTTTQQFLDHIKELNYQLTRYRGLYEGGKLTAKDRKYYRDKIAKSKRGLQIRKVFERRIAQAKGV